jgi:hypothetical protein
LDIQQGPNESTRAYIDRFLEVVQDVKDFDDKIAILAIRWGLKKGNLLFEAHKAQL